MSINFTSSQAMVRSAAPQWQTPSYNDAHHNSSAQSPIGKLLSQLDSALQDPSTNARNTLDDLLDALSNSDDPVLQDMALQASDDNTSVESGLEDDTLGTDSGTEESAEDTLRQLLQALSDYDQANQAGGAQGRGAATQGLFGGDLNTASSDLYY